MKYILSFPVVVANVHSHVDLNARQEAEPKRFKQQVEEASFVEGGPAVIAVPSPGAPYAATIAGGSSCTGTGDCVTAPGNRAVDPAGLGLEPHQTTIEMTTQGGGYAASAVNWAAGKGQGQSNIMFAARMGTNPQTLKTQSETTEEQVGTASPPTPDGTQTSPGYVLRDIDAMGINFANVAQLEGASTRCQGQPTNVQSGCSVRAWGNYYPPVEGNAYLIKFRQPLNGQTFYNAKSWATNSVDLQHPVHNDGSYMNPLNLVHWWSRTPAWQYEAESMWSLDGISGQNLLTDVHI